jgi:glycosyltransferase involved in cell wall biosynthesis
MHDSKGKNNTDTLIRVANILEEGKLGGPQMRVARIACKLNSDVDTIVILPKENSERFRKSLEGCGTRYKAINLTRLTKEFSVLLRYVLFSLGEVISLARYLNKEKFDLVHISGGAWQIKGLLASKLARKKVVWHLNDTNTPLPVKIAFKLLSKLPDYYIFSSRRTKEYYFPLMRDKKIENSIITPPVDTSHFLPSYTSQFSEELKEKYKGKKVIGTVANINPIKNIEMFLRVASVVSQQVDDVIFVIVGMVTKNQNSYFRRVTTLKENLNLDNIVFVGASDDVRSYFKLFDLYLCTSVEESGPMTLWEAMSMQCCVVSTDVGDAKDYVKIGSSGEVVDVNDFKGMAEKVVSLLENLEKRVMCSKKARNIAIEKLDISVCANKHLKVYQQLSI